MVTDYQIALIVITIIGFIISTAFYVYFVYIPAARAEDKIDTFSAQGEALVDLVNQGVTNIQEETIEILTNICESIKSLICTYNTRLPFEGCNNDQCPLTLDAYPNYCKDLVPFTNSCTDCPLT
jgi:hypothetical protein